MDNTVYPALYQSANSSAKQAQSEYLFLIRAEYGLLLIASILGMNWSSTNLYHIGYAFVFVLAAIALLFRSIKKPEESWYRSRALAESIKTSTWRYMMRAEPFVDAKSIEKPRAEFREYLREILKTNQQVGDVIAGDPSSVEEQVTNEMEQIRLTAIEERKEVYRKDRIENQKKWYSDKAKNNKKAFRFWIAATVCIYLASILSVLAQIAYPTWELWPTHTLVVLASAFIGWIQIKKFNELASSYTLTAHEIGIIQSRIDEVNNEEQFSDFVNESELAFSREHTQWVARQHE